MAGIKELRNKVVSIVTDHVYYRERIIYWSETLTTSQIIINRSKENTNTCKTKQNTKRAL